jgi:hypothetical protein
VRLGVVIGCGEVQLSRVGIFHADAPALHGRDTEEESVILFFFGSLNGGEKSG